MKLKDLHTNESRGTNDTTKKEVREIPVSEVYERSNVRKEFNSTKMEELKMSIKEQGLIQPVVVYKYEKKYWLLVGHRRHKAFAELAKENPDRFYKIPCVVKHDIDYDTITEAQIIENIQREDLCAADLINCFEHFRSEKNYSLEQISTKLGKSLGWVKNSSMAVGRLDEETKEYIKSHDVVTNSDIKEIASLPSKYHLGLLQEKAESKIKTVSALREKVAEIKEREGLKSKTTTPRKKHSYLTKPMTFPKAKHKAKFFNQTFNIRELSNYERDEIIHYARCLIQFLQGKRQS